MRLSFSRALVAGLALTAIAACGSDDDEPTGPSTIRYRATLNGANERPNPVTTAATGVADFTLDGSTLTYTITTNGLSGPSIGAHIHVGSASQAGGVVVNFPNLGTAVTGTLATGTVNLSGMVSAGVTGDSLRALLNNGNAYVNVHTQMHQGGEVRGQIMRM